MSALIKKILDGIINMTSTESQSGEKEIRMLNFKTNVPELDLENIALFRAATILESIGNDPNPSANEFYAQLVISDLPVDSHQEVTLAAISIETMMNLDLSEDDWGEPTIH
jgi:hypothetical protein